MGLLLISIFVAAITYAVCFIGEYRRNKVYNAGVISESILFELKQRYPYTEMNYDQFKHIFYVASEKIGVWTVSSDFINRHTSWQDSQIERIKKNEFIRFNTNDYYDLEEYKKSGIKVVSKGWRRDKKFDPILITFGGNLSDDFESGDVQRIPKEATLIIFPTKSDKISAYSLVEKYVLAKSLERAKKYKEEYDMKVQKKDLANVLNGVDNMQKGIMEIRKKAEQQIDDCQAQMLDLTTRTLNEREQPRLDLSQTKPELKV